MLLATGSVMADSIEDQPFPEIQIEQTTAQAPNLVVITIKVLFGTILIIGLAMFLIKLLSKHTNKQIAGNYLNIKEQIGLGNNKALAICQIGSEHYALGITDHHISLIAKISNEDLEQIESNSNNSPFILTDLSTAKPFYELVNDLKNKVKVRRDNS